MKSSLATTGGSARSPPSRSKWESVQNRELSEGFHCFLSSFATGLSRITNQTTTTGMDNGVGLALQSERFHLLIERSPMNAEALSRAFHVPPFFFQHLPNLRSFQFFERHVGE